MAIRIKSIALVIFCACALSAQAQTKNFNKFEGNPNLLKPVGQHTEGSVSAVAVTGSGTSTSTNTGVGAEFSLRHSFNSPGYLEMKLGTSYSSAGTRQSSSWMEVGGGFSTKVDKPVRFTVGALVGYDGIQRTAISTDGTNQESLTYTTLEPAIGGSVALYVRLSQRIQLKLGVDYMHAITKDGEVHEPEGWELKSYEVDANRLRVSLGLTAVFDCSKQISGDHCWLASLYGGITNQGPIAGIGAERFNRTGFDRALRYGALSEIRFKDGNKYNRTFGTIGYCYLPRGARSFAILSGHLDLGLGQEESFGSGEATSINFYSHTQNTTVGVLGRVRGDVECHFNRVTVSAGMFAGAGTTLNHTYKGGYETGQTEKNSSTEWGAMLSIAVRLK
jgi:hypothetical protein